MLCFNVGRKLPRKLRSLKTSSLAARIRRAGTGRNSSIQASRIQTHFDKFFFVNFREWKIWKKESIIVENSGVEKRPWSKKKFSGYRPTEKEIFFELKKLSNAKNFRQTRNFFFILNFWKQHEKFLYIFSKKIVNSTTYNRYRHELATKW